MSENKIIKGPSLSQTLQGFYKVGVVDENHNVIWEQKDWEKNLIVNTGMDALVNYTYAQAFNVGDAGTGTRVNFVTSSDSMAMAGGGSASLIVGTNPDAIISFTQSLTGYTRLCEAGDVIQFSDGTVCMVSASGNVTMSLTANTTASVDPSQSFIIWKTSQTALQTHIKYAAQSNITDASVVSGMPYTGTSVAANKVSMFRTFDFAKETSVLREYTEIGLRFGTGASIGTLFSRVLLPNSVSVDVNQRLRLSYGLQVTFQPTSSQSRLNIPISGWGVGSYPELATNTNASESMQNFTNAYSTVDTGGSSGGYYLLEPAARGGTGGGDGGCGLFVSRNTQSLVTFGAVTPDRRSPGATYGTFGILPYTSSNYYVLNSITFGEASANYTDIGSVGIGWYRTSYPSSYPAAPGNQVFVTVFEQTHSKANTQTLTLTWRTDWSRILST